MRPAARRAIVLCYLGLGCGVLGSWAFAEPYHLIYSPIGLRVGLVALGACLGILTALVVMVFRGDRLIDLMDEMLEDEK